MLEDKTVELFKTDLYRTILEEFHQSKDSLRKQLFLLGEEILITQEIPDWKALKTSSAFIQAQGYKTPFSCILDIKNPVASINLHGDILWMAHNISYEFIEYLSFTNNEIATMLTEQREKNKEILHQWKRGKDDEAKFLEDL